MKNCTAVRVTPTGIDVNGDPVASDPVETALGPCAVAPGASAPGASAEILARGREGVTIDATLYAPYGSGVAHTDLIRISGAASLDGLYTVDAEPGSWASPFTDWQPGDVIALRRATG